MSVSEMDYAIKVAKKGWVTEMEHAGFKAGLRRARRLEDCGHAHGLPSGVPVPIFPIAALPGAPEDWSREAGTYVCPVDIGWGLWFDWTMNDGLNTAIVPSVKGMNPLTGMKLEGLGLEQYADKCPKHGCAFTHGNHCPECGYNWPPQNYVCAPNTLWWDGFRQPDGKVRQFFFSEDEARDIASAVIGKENTVPAFGFGFYRPKNPRTPPKVETRDVSHCYFMSNGGGDLMGASGEQVFGSAVMDSAVMDYDHCSTSSAFCVYTSFSGPQGAIGPCGSKGPTGSKGFSGKVGGSVLRGSRLIGDQSAAPKRARVIKAKVKSVAVGAGAEIRQDLCACSLGLEGWQDKPASIIRLYFCFKPQFEKMVEKGGIKEFEKEPKGFMKGLPVG